MALLTPAVLGLRRDPRLLKLPPYLSLLCIFIGVAWLLVLPLNEYSRRTYVSENALLPAQVHTYFGGSEHEVFRAYRHEVGNYEWSHPENVTKMLDDILSLNGLKVATQRYEYRAAGRPIAVGRNVYGIIQGPRADATEALVLMAAWKTKDGKANKSAVALVLTLARYFKRWSLWSKDIILVITGDSTAGPQAWVDAYHDAHDSSLVEDLPIKGGALQGAIVLEYTAGIYGHRFDKLHMHYDGVNGQLPNLDLINTLTNIANHQVGIGITFQGMHDHQDTYQDRLETLLYGMVNQGLGHAEGPHSSFMPYHVDAVTLQTVGSGWHDEMSLGRVVEGGFRSLNNLLEHLHQSFFFYLLMESRRFVSIGTYLPSAMLIAVSFSIMSIALWVQSGRPDKKPAAEQSKTERNKQAAGHHGEKQVVEHEGQVAVVPPAELATKERILFPPVAVVCIAHFIGLVPLYLFNNLPDTALTAAFAVLAIGAPILPLPASYLLTKIGLLTHDSWILSSAFSLLLLGIYLSTLSTLNFSLGLFIGLLTAPLIFLRPTYYLARRDNSEPSSSDAIPATTLTPASTPSSTPTSTPTKSLAKKPSRSQMKAARKRSHQQLKQAKSQVQPNSSFRESARPAVRLFLLGLLSPTTVIFLLSYFATGSFLGISYILKSASFAWAVNRTWTCVVVWLVWWPAWFVAACAVAAEALNG